MEESKITTRDQAAEWCEQHCIDVQFNVGAVYIYSVDDGRQIGAGATLLEAVQVADSETEPITTMKQWTMLELGQLFGVSGRVEFFAPHPHGGRRWGPSMIIGFHPDECIEVTNPWYSPYPSEKWAGELRVKLYGDRIDKYIRRVVEQQEESNS